MKRFRSNISVNIISGIVAVFIIVICLVGYVGYHSFTRVLSEQYSDTAYRTAATAAALVNGSRLDDYLADGGTTDEYKRTWERMSELCNLQNSTFIYVIRPEDNYSHIRFVFNTVNKNSGFAPYSIGLVKNTTNDEYKEIYRQIYEEGVEKATVVRDTGFIETGSHITELIPVKDGEKVTGILCVQRQMEALDSARGKYLLDIIFVLIGPILIVIVLYGIYLYRRLIKPVKIITKEAERFAHENSAPPKTLSSQIDHKDEIGVLARSIDSMTTETLRYIEHLTEATAAREKISTQLEVATAIQQTSLPQSFPAFPDRDEFNIYASMTPALEVGGDFYNFFLVDDDHLAMVIADVSDKGIGAALFMMVSNILIENRTVMGGKPSDILAFVNDKLCSHNELSMFVTVWLGIMEISTGEIIAANAGHEYPIIKTADGKFEVYKDDPHCPMLGVIEGIRPKDYTIKLDEGGALYVYTDGVAEAEDIDHNQFGVQRTIDALNVDKEADATTLINNVKAAISGFVKDAPQFDDTTMLCIKRATKPARQGKNK